MAHLRSLHILVRYLVQNTAIATIVLLAIGSALATLMAATGQWPWIEVPLSWNGQILPQSGLYVQVGLTALAIGLLAFLPSNRRILQLENSHRQFHVGMKDIVRAYGAVHAADRGDAFQLSGEFEAVRERLAYLRDHPDLSHLEPEVLEVAAQMSFLSKELSETYSDANVARARGFLAQRQHEVEQFNQRLDRAKAISAELSHWRTQVELEESVAAAQLDRLRDALEVVMPELGVETIVPLVTDLDASASKPEAAKVPHLPRAAE